VGFWKSDDEITSQWQVERRFEPAMASERANELRARWTQALERARAGTWPDGPLGGASYESRGTARPRARTARALGHRRHRRRGATGMGVAVDAASRGYDTLLVEQHDFGKGTSSRSTKLVHGGVRYLEQGAISLVMEALKERGLLRQNAPHLVTDLAFVVPNYEWWEAPFYGVGLKVYDMLAGRYGFGRRRSSRKKKRWRGCRRSRPRVCAAASSTTTDSSTTRGC
jgi:hypothetical protein